MIFFLLHDIVLLESHLPRQRSHGTLASGISSQYWCAERQLSNWCSWLHYMESFNQIYKYIDMEFLLSSLKLVQWRNGPDMDRKQKTKTNRCFVSSKVMSGQVSLMKQFQSESEQFWALLILEETPWGKITRHWLWRVKYIRGMWHGVEPRFSSRNWKQVIKQGWEAKVLSRRYKASNE